jgi:hypothetical protein
MVLCPSAVGNAPRGRRFHQLPDGCPRGDHLPFPNPGAYPLSAASEHHRTRSYPPLRRATRDSRRAAFLWAAYWPPRGATLPFPTPCAYRSHYRAGSSPDAGISFLAARQSLVLRRAAFLSGG